MPSGKFKAARDGRPYAPPRSSAPASTTRFGLVPTDPELARVQEDMRAGSGPGGGTADGTSPFKHGQVIEVDFADGLNQTVPTQLGGPAAGFVIVDKVGDAVADILRDDDTTTDPINPARSDSHIKLRASAICRVKLWVWR